MLWCKKNLWIAGAGGLAKEVYNLFSGEYNFKGYLDENRNNCDFIKKVYCIDDYLLRNYQTHHNIIVCVGEPVLKQRLSQRLYPSSLSLNLIHKTSIVGNTVFSGGCIVFPNVIFTANNVVGRGCMIYQNCSISHDTSVGDYCNITPGVDIAGRCKIGNRVYLGIGCVISNDVNICDDVIVGAGAVVIDNITEPGTYVGIPARKIK